MSLDAHSIGRMRGSALMIALFVIVVMALLAAAMGRFLVESGEKHTVEVRSIRALLAAQSGVEMALYRLFPNRTAVLPTPPALCEANQDHVPLTFTGNPGLVDCQVMVRCVVVPVAYQGLVSTGFRLGSVGSCGHSDLAEANPRLKINKTILVETYDVFNKG